MFVPLVVVVVVFVPLVVGVVMVVPVVVVVGAVMVITVSVVVLVTRGRAHVQSCSWGCEPVPGRIMVYFRLRA